MVRLPHPDEPGKSGSSERSSCWGQFKVGDRIRVTVHGESMLPDYRHGATVECRLDDGAGLGGGVDVVVVLNSGKMLFRRLVKLGPASILLAAMNQDALPGWVRIRRADVKFLARVEHVLRPQPSRAIPEVKGVDHGTK
jgi:phage repressor protein C with HTH and peptisase S24 domain